MLYSLIVCRSLTYAQRTAAVLGRGGITATIFRSPRAIAQEGCSYCVRVARQRLTDALLLLGRAGLPPKRVLMLTQDGLYQEVVL